MAKQNYRQQKKQKEQARKLRQAEKQQRRQARVDTVEGKDAEAPPDVATESTVPAGASGER